MKSIVNQLTLHQAKAPKSCNRYRTPKIKKAHPKLFAFAQEQHVDLLFLDTLTEAIDFLTALFLDDLDLFFAIITDTPFLIYNL